MVESVSLLQMVIAYGLLVLVFGLAAWNRLDINKDLAIASLRMTVQLAAVGLILRYLFEVSLWYTTLILLLIMTGFAVHVVLGRVKRRVSQLPLILFISIGFSSFAVIAAFIFVIVDHEPWYDAQYVIPIGGMIIGNAMTASALATERLLSEVRSSRGAIEMMLSLGATSREASLEPYRAAYRAALLPTIASMTGMGIVHLPGMMTGQVLSGVEPLLAVKYQIAIVLAIISAAAISCLVCLYLERRRIFNRCHQISLDELNENC